VRKYAALFAIGFKDRMSAPAEVAARSVFFAVIIYVFSRLWQTLAASGAPFGAGTTARELVWYLFITEAIVLSLPPLPEQVDHEIQTGNISYQLVRPLDYIGSRAMGFLGDVLARFAVNAAVGIVAALALVGLPAEPGRLAAAVPLVLGAFLIHLGMSLSISMLGFWVEDTLPFFWIYSKAAFILGGLFMPIDFYPQWLQRFCQFLPLRDGVYSVARMALRSAGRHAEVARLIERQLLWAGGGILLAWALCQAGLRRLEARGG
jgi:ABC-2 type transport system permease protein